MDEAELDHDRDPTPSRRNTLHQAQTVINRTLFIKKAEVCWTCEGDHNTRYFYSIVQGRRIRARIRSITSASSEVFESPKTIKPLAVSFFQEFLSAPSQSVDPIRPGIIPRLVSDEDLTPTLTEKIVLYNLWIEADSTLAMYYITRGGGRCSIQDTLRYIRHLFTFDRDTISHIYREENQVADLRASECWDRCCYCE
ncbi:Uncharacterized protein Adt_34073 [Abeliophyllum distichum]|uniref:RNase H type-1 domain-containing protein n=1 Tax=Abeliophyllum distichum TaxID=126358 RepID=A0ABD1QY23_9LAMI